MHGRNRSWARWRSASAIRRFASRTPCCWSVTARLLADFLLQRRTPIAPEYDAFTHYNKINAYRSGFAARIRRSHDAAAAA